MYDAGEVSLNKRSLKLNSYLFLYVNEGITAETETYSYSQID